MKNIKLPISITIFSFTLLSFFGCQTEHATESFVGDNEKISEYLLELGYQLNDLEVGQTGVAFDHDARMDRGFILDAADGKISNEHDHAEHDSLAIEHYNR